MRVLAHHARRPGHTHAPARTPSDEVFAPRAAHADGPPSAQTARRARRRPLAVLLVALGAAASAWAVGKNAPLTTAEWLVDLARDVAASKAGEQTPADVMHVQVLLRAALRLNRKLPEAYSYLYEFATLENNPAEAAGLLQALLNCDPSHQAAFARWLDLGAAAQQTIEARREWLNKVQTALQRPPEIAAMIHAQLARLSLQAVDRQTAREELIKALTLDPHNPDAPELVIGLLSDTSTPTERLRAAWRAVRANPFSCDAVWRVAMILQEAGLSNEAGVLLDSWREFYTARNLPLPLSVDHRLLLVTNLLARGLLDEARSELEEVIRQSPAHTAEAGMLLYYVALKQNKAEEAKSISSRLAARFEPIREPAEWPENELAQAAWFHCVVDPQAQRALMLAEAAAARAPNDPFLRRVLGIAQAANFQADAARATLEPLVKKDVYAAYALARLARENGDEAAARTILNGLSVPILPGPAQDLVQTLGLGPVGPGMNSPTALELRQALDGLDRASLDFARSPDQFLRATIAFDDPSVAIGEPWHATITLKSTAKFPITLGADGMVNPVVLLNFTFEGDRQRELTAALSISLDRARVLPPDGSLSIRRTLDIGAPRRINRQTPQQLQRVGVRGWLDPVLGSDGQWRPAVGGQVIAPAYFNRLPVRTESSAIEKLLRDLAEAGPVRFRAIETLAALLGEAQRAELNKLSYRPDPIPYERIEQALLDALLGGDVELTTRALESLATVGLSQRLIEGVGQCLGHANWLVRLMSLRVAQRQGPNMRETFERLARRDEDELVRALAGCYLSRWQEESEAAAAAAAPTAPHSSSAPTTAPTPAPTPSPREVVP